MRHFSTFVRVSIVVLLLSSCTKKDKEPQGPDTSPPYVKAVISLDTTEILVSSNEVLNMELATDTLNYLITSYETLDVHIVNIDPMIKNCILGTEPQESTFYEIDIKNIKDVSGNTMKDTTITFHGIGVMPDSFPPILQITYPGDGDTLYGFEYFSLNASDNTAVKKVYFYLGDSLIAEDKYKPYYCILDVRNLTEGGIYSIWASAVDYSANVGYSETLDVFIGFHPPFPYVVIDIIVTDKIPYRADITEDGTKHISVHNHKWTQPDIDDLVILNTATNSIEKTIHTFSGSSYYLDVFENDLVYFTSGSSFWVYDIFLGELIDTVDVGDEPQGIVRSNDEKLYIARNFKQDILVYSTQQSSILDSIPLSGCPTALAIDTVHKELYVCYGNQVTVIDAEGDSVITSISISGNAFEIVFSPNCDRAYVSELTNSIIGVIETSSHTLLDELSFSELTHPKGMAVTSDGNYLFVTGAYDKVLVINTFDYNVEWILNVGPMPYSAVITPFNDKVYVTCLGDERPNTSTIYCIGY